MKGYGLGSLLAGMLLIAGSAGAQPYRFVPFDVSCDAGAAACPTGLAPGASAIQTSARGINARGEVVGFYVDTSGAQHGFLLQNGTYTTLDVSFPGVRATIANARDEIVGQFLLPVNPDVPQDSPVYCPADLSPNNPDPACIKGSTTATASTRPSCSQATRARSPSGLRQTEKSSAACTITI